MNIPAYLRPYATNADIGKHAITFRVKCSCGCDRIQLVERALTPAEKAAAEKWKGYVSCQDENDRFYMVKQGFFGTKRIEVTEEEADLLVPVGIAKAVCSVCGKEILLFDETVHGYDVSDPRIHDEESCENEDDENEIDVFEPLGQPGAVGVKLKYDMSFKEFVKDAECTYDDDFDEDNAEAYYELAFTAIEIQAEENGRLKTLFTRNTAESIF